ncbi:metallophosphoesterase family protein [Rhodopseudomonas palustris]
MTFRLLIIDDELDEAARSGPTTRRELYQCLSDRFDLLFLETADQLGDAISSGSIHAVLMDFVLARWSVDARSLLQIIDGRCLVFLISSHWGPNFDDLRHTLQAYDISQIFTWEEIEDAERRSLISLWIGASINKSKSLSPITLAADEPLRILQLSDMHFGSVAPAAFASETERAAQAIVRKWGSAPHFIALTGDLTDHGLPSEYSTALNWLTTFGKKLDPCWAPEQFLLIPGNHDVCWPLGWSSHINVERKVLEPVVQPELNELRQFALAPFRQFARQLTNNEDWSGERHHWTSGRFRHLGVIFFGLNTCEELDDWSRPTQHVSDSTVASIFREVRHWRKDAEGAVVMGLMHHPLTSNAPSDSIQNQTVLLKNLSGDEFGSIVTLSGHAHDTLSTLQNRSGVSFLEITASSTNKLSHHRPEDTSRGFNMIEVIRKNGSVSGVIVRSFRFESISISVGEERRYTRQKSGEFKAQGQRS